MHIRITTDQFGRITWKKKRLHLTQDIYVDLTFDRSYVNRLSCIQTTLFRNEEF